MLAYYREHGRDLPWRRTRDPYSILVSEVMLQQTQVARVLPKYERFLAEFPSIFALAEAAVVEVLAAWQGLGYNRRALALHQAAGRIVTDEGGIVPRSPGDLARLPGIGAATAAAVCVFAYGVPLAFIETNVRAAVIHHFFPGETSVRDTDLLPIVEASLDRAEPRQWYYALMDYGVWVKKTHANPSRRSRHHKMQSSFTGSHRQLRALVLRTLLTVAPAMLGAAELRALVPEISATEAEIAAVAHELAAEGFLMRQGDRYRVV